MNEYLMKLYRAYDKTKPYENHLVNDEELKVSYEKVKEVENEIIMCLEGKSKCKSAVKMLDELSCQYMKELCAYQKHDFINGVVCGVFLGMEINDLKDTAMYEEILNVINKLNNDNI